MAEQVERLAHHALQGRGVGQGRALLPSRRGRRLGASAYREAVAYFEQALEALGHLPEHPDAGGSWPSSSDHRLGGLLSLVGAREESRPVGRGRGAGPTA